METILDGDGDYEVVEVNEDGSVDDVDSDQTTTGRGRIAEEPKQTWPAEVLEAAKGLIDQKFIDEGGDYRENQFGMVYWLDLNHLVEFEQADKRITKDSEFWRWFDDYRRDHSIWSVNSDTAWGRSSKGKQKDKPWKSWKSSDSWDSKGWDSAYKSGKNYMSSWWSGWGYHGSEDTRKLTIAVGAVQSIVSVINQGSKKFRVVLAAEDNREAPTSFTSFDDQLVVVSPQALLDKKLSENEGIEVTAGYGLHEGSHVQYTGDLMSQIQKPTPLRPLAVAAILLNLLEDVRIEALTSENYPGFTNYFERALEYLWGVTSANAPRAWGPELGDIVNAITATTKWPTEYKPIVDASNDAQLQSEFVWFSDWRDRYDPDHARDAVQEALDHLNQNPQTKQQMDKLQKAEEAYEKAQGMPAEKLSDKDFKALLEELKKQLKDSNGKPVIDSCPSGSPGGKRIELTAKQSQEIQQMLREELKQHQPGVGGGQGPTAQIHKIFSKKPEENAQSKAAYQKPGPLVAKLKQAFVFRKVAPEWAERALRSGELDEDRMWGVVGNDLRVFQRKEIIDQPKTQVTLLVDMSGSMDGENIRTAQLLANTMMECLKGIRGVSVRVRGYTNLTGEADIYRIWENGDPVTRLGLISTMPKGGTPDGLALDWCANEMLAQSRPGEDMVIFMLNDGMPNGTAINGLSGDQYVKMVVDESAKKGIQIVQVMLPDTYGWGSYPGNHRDMTRWYRNTISFSSTDQLARDLTRILIRVFGGVKQ